MPPWSPLLSTHHSLLEVRTLDRRERSVGHLHVDDLTRAVSSYWCSSPNVSGRVVISADAGIVATRTAASDQSTVEVGERSHWLQDRALGASIVAFEKVERRPRRWDCQISCIVLSQ